MRAYTLRAECHLLKRDYAAAWPDCRRALELDPQDSLALRTMGHVQVGRGQFEDALRAYEQGMKDDTGRGRDFFYRARLRRIAGQLESSLRDCDRAVEAEPGRAFVVASRAVTRRMLGDREGAIEDLKKAIALNPLDWALQGNLLIWDIHALDGEKHEVDPAQAALADAEASEEAEKSPYGRLLSDLCTGRQSAESVFSQVEGNMEECLAAYFAGVRAAVDGRTTDAEAWFAPHSLGAHLSRSGASLTFWANPIKPLAKRNMAASAATDIPLNFFMVSPFLDKLNWNASPLSHGRVYGQFRRLSTSFS